MLPANSAIVWPASMERSGMLESFSTGLEQIRGTISRVLKNLPEDKLATFFHLPMVLLSPFFLTTFTFITLRKMEFYANPSSMISYYGAYISKHKCSF